MYHERFMEKPNSRIITDKEYILSQYIPRHVDFIDQGEDVRLFRYHSFKALLCFLSKPLVMPVTSEGITLPQGTRVAYVDFTPLGDVYGEEGNTSHALYKGINTFSTFTRYVERVRQTEPALYPEYLIGDTNKRFARFIQKRLGFNTVITPESTLLPVLGRTEEVLTMFTNEITSRYASNDSFARLRERAKRERMRMYD